MSNDQESPKTKAPERTSNQSEFHNQFMLESLKDTMSRAMYAKTEMCKAEPMSDNPPLLLVAYSADSEHDPRLTVGNKEKIKVGMIPLIHADDVRECLVDVIGSLPSEKFEFLMLAVEGYHDTAPNSDSPPRGSLEKDFTNNPFTTVKEGVLVSGVDWEHKLAITGHCTYSYDDGGVPVFDKEQSWSQVEISEDTGMMTFIMGSACAFIQKKILTEKFHALLEEAGESE